MALFGDLVWFLLFWSVIIAVGLWSLLCVLIGIGYVLYKLYQWARAD